MAYGWSRTWRRDPASKADEPWSEPGELSDLRTFFAGWPPQCQTILDRIEEPVARCLDDDRSVDDAAGLAARLDAGQRVARTLDDGRCVIILRVASPSGRRAARVGSEVDNTDDRPATIRSRAACGWWPAAAIEG